MLNRFTDFMIGALAVVFGLIAALWPLWVGLAAIKYVFF